MPNNHIDDVDDAFNIDKDDNDNSDIILDTEDLPMEDIDLDENDESLIEQESTPSDAHAPNPMADGVNQEHRVTKPFNTQLANDLDLKLTVESGSVLISLQSLLTLKPQDVLDIASLPPKVSLVVNGITIGQGLLVEINGRVGVKITQLINQQLIVNEQVATAHQE